MKKPMTIFLAAFMASLSIAAPDLLADASQKRKLQILMDLDPHFPKPIAKIVADYSYESNGMVSAGDFHTCVVKADGTIRCWGDNSDGQAVVPAGFISGVSQVSAGYDQTCVVKADGTLGCWGRNQHGQAVVPAGFISGVSQVSAGDNHTCAVKTDGTLGCWGRNQHGQATVPA